MNRAILGCVLALLTASGSRAITPEQSGSVYYAYPAAEPLDNSTIPEGFTPIYISHYGRHGSRWLPDARRYDLLLDELVRLDSLGQLTPLGQDVLGRVRVVRQDANGNEGRLTPLGHRQHEEIAQRMAQNFPELFEEGDSVNARSSTVARCGQSMEAFLSSLNSERPALRVGKETSEATMAVMAPREGAASEFFAEDSPWQTTLWQEMLGRVDLQRFLSQIVKDPAAVDDPGEVFLELYWYASDMQNVEPQVSFYDLFTLEDLATLWQAQNQKMYTICGPSPVSHGFPEGNAVATLEDIVQLADSALARGNVAAHLRFGHDSHLLRLLSLMQVNEASASVKDLTRLPELWRDYELSPMAANLQLVFYRSPEGELYVRPLLNERPVTFPIKTNLPGMYPWKELRAHLLKRLSQFQ